MILTPVYCKIFYICKYYTILLIGVHTTCLGVSSLFATLSISLSATLDSSGPLSVGICRAKDRLTKLKYNVT